MICCNVNNDSWTYKVKSSTPAQISQMFLVFYWKTIIQTKKNIYISVISNLYAVAENAQEACEP